MEEETGGGKNMTGTVRINEMDRQHYIKAEIARLEQRTQRKRKGEEEDQKQGKGVRKMGKKNLSQ